MKTWELVKDFQLKFPYLVKDLVENSHHWDEKNLNPHHLEAPTTFAHCMMVLLMSEHYNDPLVVRLAALIHDLGKPMATSRDEEKMRVRMFGHEPLSMFLGLDYLKTLNLTKEEVIHICKLVCYHTHLYTTMRQSKNYQVALANFFKKDHALFLDLVKLSRADALGRFSESEDREFWKNAEQNFLPISNLIKNTPHYSRKFDSDKEVVILVGPPLSGKTTWVNNHAKNHFLLSRDQVILDMANMDNMDQAWEAVDHEKVNIEFGLKKKEAVESGKNIVFDLTHVSQKDRRRALSGISTRYKRKAIVFLTAYQTLVDRNKIRSQNENKSIPHYVLLKMMKGFSIPTLSEGFDEIEFVVEGCDE